MNKYEEALEILIDKAVTKDVVCLKEYNIIKEAIAKAEKYEEELSNPLTISAKILRENKDLHKRVEELEQENKELKAMLECVDNE